MTGEAKSAWLFDNRISKAFEILPLDFVRVQMRVQVPPLSGFPWLASGAVVFVGFTRARQGKSEIGKARKEPLAGRFSSDVALRYSSKVS